MYIYIAVKKIELAFLFFGVFRFESLLIAQLVDPAILHEWADVCNKL